MNPFGINYDLVNEANDGEFSTWSVVVRWSMVEVDNWSKQCIRQINLWDTVYWKCVSTLSVQMSVEFMIMDSLCLKASNKEFICLSDAEDGSFASFL